LKYSEQLVLQDSPKKFLLSALGKISKAEIQTQAQEVVVKYETAFLKKHLNIKATHKKSRIRMTKKHIGYAKLFTQEEVDDALEEYKTKQRALIKVVAKKRG
jgi:uncharacterized protein YjaZ